MDLLNMHLVSGPASADGPPVLTVVYLCDLPIMLEMGLWCLYGYCLDL